MVQNRPNALLSRSWSVGARLPMKKGLLTAVIPVGVGAALLKDENDPLSLDEPDAVNEEELALESEDEDSDWATEKKERVTTLKAKIYAMTLSYPKITEKKIEMDRGQYVLWLRKWTYVEMRSYCST